MSYSDQGPGDGRSSEGAWEKLSRVAVKGAEYNSRERQPHPKCLKGTRVNLLDHIYGLLDNSAKSQLIWLHGTAGVGKSAVAFTVAEKMRGLIMATQRTTNETRLAGTFFFSRKYAKRTTTGYVFATLAYQLARHFLSVQEDLGKTIRRNPTLLDPDSSLHGQMNALFLQPLLLLRYRLRECSPLVFVVDALDECTSEAEIVDLISFLGQALCNPDLPVTHILFTSRSERYIRNAFQEHGVRPLVCEIPTTVSGEGLTTTISLNGTDVDNDIYIFMEHSFARLGGSPQPTRDELVQLVSRAGRRFIVASKMMKFIDDGGDDSRDRLQLMLESPELLRLLELQDPQENEKEELKAEQREYPVSIDPLQSSPPVTPETMLQDLTVYITKVDNHAIARGGFGEVWRCTYEKDGRVVKVAVKALLIYTSDQDGEALEKKTRRILRELRICARLEHRNVLPVYGYAHGFGILMAIVSPWAENGNLTTYLEKKSVELDIVRRFQILRDITDGLQYLHTNNIIHGDLTGPNVLVHGDGTACLADFGLSLMYSEVISPSVASWTSSCHGNFRWMAPELLREQDDGLPVRPTKRSDIYSFGGIMLQVLTNKIPYHYLSDVAASGCIYNNVTPARSRYPGVSDKYWYFIGDCWSRTPQDRPPTERVVEVIKNELDSLSSSSTGS